MAPVRIDTCDGIAIVTIDNPPVNALSQSVRQGLLDSIRGAQDDGSRALVMQCEGRTFIAGADITEFGKPPMEPYLPDLLNEIEASGKLVVAALHGTALGGGFETALACHYRIAAASEKSVCPRSSWVCCPGQAVRSGFPGSRVSRQRST